MKATYNINKVKQNNVLNVREVKHMIVTYRPKVTFSSDDLISRYSYLIGQFLYCICSAHDLSDELINRTAKEIYYSEALSALRKWVRLRDENDYLMAGKVDLTEVYHIPGKDYIFSAFKRTDNYINLLIDKNGAIQLNNIQKIINLLEDQVYKSL